jgi:hypothetical protein
VVSTEKRKSYAFGARRMSAKSSSKRAGLPTHKKEQAKKTVGTKLWAADDKLFHEIVGRRRTRPAILLREIVHDWAVAFRLSGQAKDPNELAGPIRQLHEQILAEQLRPMNEALATILSQMNTRTHSEKIDTNLVPRQSDSEIFSLLQSLAEELASTKKQLAELRAFAVAHYVLSGQSFSVIWAILEFTQFLAEQFLMNQPEFKKNYLEVATTRRDEARSDGLELVQRMSLKVGYPDQFQLILFDPPDEPS